MSRVFVFDLLEDITNLGTNGKGGGFLLSYTPLVHPSNLASLTLLVRDLLVSR